MENIHDDTSCDAPNPLIKQVDSKSPAVSASAPAKAAT